MNSLAGGVSADRGHVEIYGMTQSQMNQLSTYGVPVGNTFNNRISIQAGDAVCHVPDVRWRDLGCLRRL